MNRAIPFVVSAFILAACGDPLAYCDEARHQCQTLEDAICEKATQCGIDRDDCLAAERSRIDCDVVEDWTGEVADCSPVIGGATCDDILSTNPKWVHDESCSEITFAVADGTCGGLD